MATVNLVRDRLAALDPVDADAITVPIYYINLDKSVDRAQFMHAQLKGTNPTRIEAVDGTVQFKRPKPGLENIGGVAIRSTYHLGATRFACTLSHIRALTQIERDGHPWALVCEDDAVLTLSSKWPSNLIQNLCTQGDEVGAGIIQLYWRPRSNILTSKYNSSTPYTLVPMIEYPCWGTVAYLVSTKGIQDILDYTGRFPLDDWETTNSRNEPLNVETPLYIDDPKNNPHHAEKYRDLPRQSLQGVADSFLYGLTPTFTSGKPLVLFDNCDMDALIGQTNVPASLSAQLRILDLY